jgi:superfamily II DNA or RNA helicase
MPPRMNGWNEQTLRAAASWKAFKAGRSLFESGVVTDAKTTAAGWQGSVSGGKRPLRVSVAVKSATDLETRCPCPENRATGELCCHAVAAGLAALAAADTPAPAETVLAAAKRTAVARELHFPSNWRQSLKRGKLTLKVTISRHAADAMADRKLDDWLSREGVAEQPQVHLHLDEARLGGFLEAITGHPAVFTGDGGVRLEISDGHRLQLAHATRIADEASLTPEENDRGWLETAGAFWQTGEDFLRRVGEGPPPPTIGGILSALCQGQIARLPVRDLLAHLETWQDWLRFPAGCWLESLHFVPATATFHLSLDGSMQQIEARFAVAYDGSPMQVPGKGDIPQLPRLRGEVCEIRDLPGEQIAVNRLESAGFQAAEPGLWILRGQPAILGFFAHNLPSWRTGWNIDQTPRFERTRQQVLVVTPDIAILNADDYGLSFDLSFRTSDGARVSINEIRQILRGGGCPGGAAGGKHLVISNDFTEVIEPLLPELDLRQEGGHFVASERSAEIILDIRNNLRNSHITSGQEKLFPYQKPASLHADLRPYQSFGAGWLLDRVERFGGAILADDMGLGKTVQTIALIEALNTKKDEDAGLILVVATASLMGNWRAEFERFAPSRGVRVLHGSDRDRERERLRPGEVILTSYGTLVRDLAWHLRQDYRLVVADEASLMRNPDTDHSRALAKLRSRRRVALTGTPVENGIRDLWSVFRFIQPGWLGTREEFRERYEQVIDGRDAAGPAVERLRLKTSPFLLRRTKQQVAPELPSKWFIDEYCDLSQDQRTVYHELLNEGRKQCESLADGGNPGAARMKMLTALLRLRQTCCDLALLGNERLKLLPMARRSAKIERLLQLLEEALSGCHRVLVFSQFQKQLLEIEQCVKERGWSSLRLDGQTRNRHELVERFQKPDGPPIFLISLKAGGYGLNLTAADTVIHFDPWWNPAAEAQATDRAHRIGQTRPVTVYRLLTRGTVEEKVVRMQSRKSAIAASIDESGAADALDLGVDELRKLLMEG